MDYNDGCCYCSNLWDPRIPGGEDTTDVAAGFRTPVDTVGGDFADFGCAESIDLPVRAETSDGSTILHTCRNFLAHFPYQWLLW